MGKYDLEMKCVQIQKYLKEKKYNKAYEVLQTIDVTRVKSIIDLKVFFEVYKNLQRYDDAKEMLIRIYQRNASRHVLYQLVCLEIKAGQLEEAENSYADFIKVCGGTDDAFILRYLIDTAKHADYAVRIESLERLKKSNYYEEWAYELAKMYHKAGDADKCIKECEDIMLWFGEGIIVEKAKMLHAYYTKGDTSFLKKPEIYKEKVESVEKPETLLYNTTDLGKQVSDIRALEKTVKLKKELKKELSYTQDIQEAIKQDIQEKPAVSGRADEFPLSEDTKTLKLGTIQEALHEILAKEEKLEDLIVGEWNLTGVFEQYTNNKTIRAELEDCFTKLKNGAELDYIYVTTENPNQNLDFVKKLAKALQKAGIVKKSQVAKIKGENLNYIQLEQRVDKLRNSVLLVEGVDSLYVLTVKALIQLMETLKGELVIVFEDTRENVKIFQEKQYDLNRENAYTINI
ncbi:tetratricopeptide repeat protein [[Clostridium] polysaccharolyticum]|uniref:Tetratricopeptide repeat-containing protein n=1 Tax=[Clostridium] polysaccharolyticum TaxID=29364 RepID=A0A1I0ERT0_9FIRM|nr:hypothetical protein [[Clostridium] polysaccharolyticum]SET48127.1 hypothetical protein SAMN04487772_12422 [[Clostridium] polysaccharolyticum]